MPTTREASLTPQDEPRRPPRGRSNVAVNALASCGANLIGQKGFRTGIAICGCKDNFCIVIHKSPPTRELHYGACVIETRIRVRADPPLLPTHTSIFALSSSIS